MKCFLICSVRLPLIPIYHKIQVDLLLLSNTDPEQLTVDHDVSLLTSFYKMIENEAY